MSNPNGYKLTTSDFAFECKVDMFGRVRKMILLYRPQSDGMWRVIIKKEI